MAGARSKKLFEEAKKHFPGGVNSPVRAFRSVGGEPLFIKRAKGSKIYDAYGKAYIDYVLSWGPMILGHAHPRVTAALKKAIADGTSYGAPTELEITLARLVKKAFPSIEMLRMVSSGTEATMSAIRVARGHTGRDKILKFEGGYHGHGDSLLVKAGSGVATFGLPDSPGVPVDLAKHTLTVSYNDLAAVREAASREGDQIACIIVEPVAGNMGCVPPEPGFLEGLRQVCDQYGIVLIFDEVMTGFRVAYGGAQQLYKIKPDLTCLGKVIGGGLPVGAFGGRREIMEKIAPLGPVYQAGTLSGNPVAVAAGLATLKLVDTPGFQEKISHVTEELVQGLKTEAQKAKVVFSAQSIGSMFGLYFRAAPPASFAEVMQCDKDRFNNFFHAMLERGVYLAPSAYEAGFVSAAHGATEIDVTLAAAREAFRA